MIMSSSFILRGDTRLAHMKMLFACVLLLFTVKDLAAQSPVNTRCPVTPSEVIGNDAVTVQFKGQTIGLCCTRCKRKFLAAPDEYAMNLPQDSAARSNEGEHHDHEEHPQSFTFVNYVGRFHPVIVHFPIALLLIAALLELTAMIRRNLPYGTAVRPILVLGTASAVVAVLLGFANAMDNPQVGELILVFERHRLGGIVTACLAVVALGFGEWWRQADNIRLARIYRIALFMGALGVALTGHFGGVLIYGLNYF